MGIEGEMQWIVNSLDDNDVGEVLYDHTVVSTMALYP